MAPQERRAAVAACRASVNDGRALAPYSAAAATRRRGWGGL